MTFIRFHNCTYSIMPAVRGHGFSDFDQHAFSNILMLLISPTSMLLVHKSLPWFFVSMSLILISMLFLTSACCSFLQLACSSFLNPFHGSLIACFLLLNHQASYIPALNWQLSIRYSACFLNRSMLPTPK